MRRGLLSSVLTVLVVAMASPVSAAPPERTAVPFPFTAPDDQVDVGACRDTNDASDDQNDRPGPRCEVANNRLWLLR